MSIAIQIHTIEKTLFDGEADSLTLPGFEGELGVLPTHIPLISSLGRGIVKIRTKNDRMEVPIEGGFAEIRPESKVVILAG